MSRTTFDDPCETCGKRPYLRVSLVGSRLVETLLECCEHERKRRGLCRDCDEPIAGRNVNALYCTAHRAEARRRVWRESKRRAYQADPEKRRAEVRDYETRHPDRVRERKRKSDRKYWQRVGKKRQKLKALRSGFGA